MFQCKFENRKKSGFPCRSFRARGAMPDFFNILNFALKDFLSVASDNFKNKKVQCTHNYVKAYGFWARVSSALYITHIIHDTEYHV